MFKGFKMKKISFFILLILLLTNCQNEPAISVDPIGMDPIFEYSPVVFQTDVKPDFQRIVEFSDGNRNGEYYPLWYKQSLTTDNYLLYPMPRKQEAYNKDKVDTIYMERKGALTVNINGVQHGVYEVKVKFKGEPVGPGALYMSTLTGGNILRYAPYGANVLHNSNQYKIITLVRAGGKVLYKDWHLGRDKNKLDYNIYGDTTLLGKEFLFGSTPTGTMFTFPHQ